MAQELSEKPTMKNMTSNQIICRFAPSPTGFLHIGNIRTAIINYLFAKKNGGKFMLRLDDTDEERVRDEYRTMIIEDMNWLGLHFDGEIIKQSDRLEIYEVAKKKLIETGRIYECFETAEELNFQRKAQIASGQRPLYDKSALNYTADQKEAYRKEGRTSYWRFLLKDQTTIWQDKVKGEIKFEGLHFSDPVIIRENNIPTYTFCSVVDDIEYNVTDVVRGEDHVTNTAVQIQIFEALGEGKIPNFSHLGLIQSSDGKLSKRKGGFDIKSLREDGFEPLSIINLLSQIGTSKSLVIENNIQNLIDKFDLHNFSKSTTNYNLDELQTINAKLLQILPFEQISKRLEEMGITEVDESFWQNIKANLHYLYEIQDWIEICKKSFRYAHQDSDKDLLGIAKSTLPENITVDSWQEWIGRIKEKTDRKGKELFMPLRLALTGKENGPELKNILPLMDREEILARLS